MKMIERRLERFCWAEVFRQNVNGDFNDSSVNMILAGVIWNHIRRYQRVQPSVRFRVIMALLAIVMTSTPKSVIAQNIEFDEFHTWTDLATIYNFNHSFRYDGDYGSRGFLTDENWTLIYLRPSVRYKNWSNVALHGGAALFYNFFKNAEDLPELRPWVGVRLTGPRPAGWVFSNYFRLELRAFYFKETSEWEARLRGRWQLQVTTPRFAIGSAEDLYALASIEPFFDIGSSLKGSFGDRFRFNLGFGKQVSRALRIDLNYLFHQIRIEDEGGRLDADDHVVRLRFFYARN